MYDDPDLGVVAISEPRGWPKLLKVDPKIRGEVVDLYKALTFDNETKLVLLLSFSTNEMIKKTMMYPGILYLWSVLVTFPKWSPNLPDYKL